MIDSVCAVTTCSADGWARYGRRMAQTWVAHWPVPLTLWTEGFACSVDGVQTRQLESVEWLSAFKAKHANCMPAGLYNYRLDAVRFAHKTAAVIESALSTDCSHLIWVDADTVAHSTVPLPFVQSLLPRASEYIAWLDRVGNYPECGFYVLNMRHKMHRTLMERWRNWYTSGALFKLPEWHDSYVLQQLVRQMGAPTKSLSGDRARLTSHPFINSSLGAYMDHLKGPRKAQGKSRRADLKTPRPENYWRSIR